MQQFSRKENFLIANTLNCIPFLLRGQAVLIDLRNDCSVAGRIDNADGHMNINLTEVVFIDRLGQHFPFEQFMVRERIIRQIHLPQHINMCKEIEEWCARGCSRRPPPLKHTKKGKRTFKQIRTEQRHREILHNIERQHKQQADRESEL